MALKEFARVLLPQGFTVITCPDLKSVCALVADDKLTDAAYTSPSGPITPIDIIYGYRPSMSKGNLFMAHRCGFTQKVLDGTLRSCGFFKWLPAWQGAGHPFSICRRWQANHPEAKTLCVRWQGSTFRGRVLNARLWLPHTGL